MFVSIAINIYLLTYLLTYTELYPSPLHIIITSSSPCSHSRKFTSPHTTIFSLSGWLVRIRSKLNLSRLME